MAAARRFDPGADLGQGRANRLGSQRLHQALARVEASEHNHRRVRTGRGDLHTQGSGGAVPGWISRSSSTNSNSPVASAVETTGPMACRDERPATAERLRDVLAAWTRCSRRVSPGARPSEGRWTDTPATGLFSAHWRDEMKARLRMRMGAHDAHYARRAGRRRADARALRRRRHRAVHPPRRRRGAVPRVRGGRVPRARCTPATSSRPRARSSAGARTSLKMEFEARKVIVPTPRRTTRRVGGGPAARAGRRLPRARHLRGPGERAAQPAPSAGRGRASSPRRSSAPRPRARRTRTCRSPPRRSPTRPRAAATAGAAVIHLHVRDDDGTRVAGRATLSRAAIRAIRARTRRHHPDLDRRRGGHERRRARRAARVQAGRAGDGDAQLRHDQLRRRRVREHAADIREMARAHPRARRGARARVLRGRPHRHRRRPGRRRGSSRAPLHFQFVLGVTGAHGGARAQPRASRRAPGSCPQGATLGRRRRRAAPAADGRARHRSWAATRASGSRTTSTSTRACSPKAARRWSRARSSCASARGREVATVAEARALLGARQCA